MFEDDENEKIEIHQHPKLPAGGEYLINNYKTKNLDKAAYLMSRGSRFLRLYFEEDTPIATVILEAVNKRHVREYWDESVKVEFWQWKNSRQFLKGKIKEKV